MSDLRFLGDLARVALVILAAAALFAAVTLSDPIWTVLAVLTLCAAVTASRQPSLGSDRGISPPDAGDALHASGGLPTTQ